MIEKVKQKLWKRTVLFITKNATIKLVKKNKIDSWKESEINHAVTIIRQVQQLSHTREQKLSLE